MTSEGEITYPGLRRFCSEHREEIEELVGHRIRCQDKAVVLRSYYDLIQQQKFKPTIIGKRYHLEKVLGKGGFGTVYLANDSKLGNVALKISPKKKRMMVDREILVLKQLQGIPGIPTLLTQNLVITNDGAAIVMEILGPSLWDTKMNIKTLPSYAIQMISILEKIHAHGIIHRDIKPANWLLGLGKKKNKLYLIDFGFATFYRNSDGSHAELRTDAPFRGTRKYASSHAEGRIEQSRRDDLISLGYTLASFFAPLPWIELYAGYKGKTGREKRKVRREAKILKESLIGLCPSPSVPDSICEYLMDVLGLEYDEEPDYDQLRSYFE